MPRSRTYTDEERRHAVDRVLVHGMTAAEAARRCGIPPDTLGSWLRRLAKGEELPHKKRPTPAVREAVRLVLEQGYTQKQAAEATGVSTNVLERSVKKARGPNAIALRRQERARRLKAVGKRPLA